MSKIKVELHQHDNFVCGRVLEMPEELRCSGTIEANDEFRIASAGKPEIAGTTLCLRGKWYAYDNIWFYYSYSNNTLATIALSNFRELIDRWNKEHKKVLDDKEKEYLSAVIKPFKNNVNFISKIPGHDFEYIYGKTNSDGFSLPVFKKDTMYKGMKSCKKYTLKELGLE